MAVYSSVWHGDQDQLDALLLAIKHNCGCRAGQQGPACDAHRALLSQRTIDGLLFGRYLADQLRGEEFAVPNLQVAVPQARARRGHAEGF